MLNEDFNPAVADAFYDLRPQLEGSKKLSLDLVPDVAQRTLKNFSPAMFNVVYNTAISEGLTTEQTIKDMFGRDVLLVLKSPKKNPSPAQCRTILQFISTLNPEEASGRKEQWRHAQPRREPENQPEL
ncbi:MAG: hypothetical protein WC989_02215 [Micavibrio sp.]